MNDNSVYEDKYFAVISPVPALNCRDDGGHLILIKKEKVRDRSDMTWQEAIDFMRISMGVGKAMYGFFIGSSSQLMLVGRTAESGHLNSPAIK